MSYKHIGTAGDLVRFGCSLRIECGDCFAANTMSATEVVLKCGTGDLGKIKRRLKCARCGARAAQLVVLDPL
jgi:ribosomal protein L40E